MIIDTIDQREATDQTTRMDKLPRVLLRWMVSDIHGSVSLNPSRVLGPCDGNGDTVEGP